MNSNTKNNIPLVTVDGPVGSGKGSLSTMLAKKLGFHLLDSGALYRVLALAIKKNNLDIVDQASIQKLVLSLNISFQEKVAGEPADIILDGVNVSRDIRQEECGELASKISRYQVVRDALMALQKSFLKLPGLVADGRDMGTVVFPNANIKFFLTASQEVRAKRRFLQLHSKNTSNDLDISYESLLEEIKQRDERDINRPLAPLKPATDAIIIDSSDLTLEQVFSKMYELAINAL